MMYIHFNQSYILFESSPNTKHMSNDFHALEQSSDVTMICGGLKRKNEDQHQTKNSKPDIMVTIIAIGMITRQPDW